MSTERSAVILVAEEDAALRELIASALELDGHRVVAVAMGPELVAEALRASPLELLIAGVRMPGGLHSLEVLRASAAGVPVILMTAFGDRWTRAAAANHGALLLSKPIELGRLRAIVRAQLERSMQRKGTW